MADNIQVPAGSGGDPAVATTERAGGEHAQHVRIDGGSGTATNLISAGQKARANSLPVSLPSDAAPANIATGQVEMSDSWLSRIASRSDRKYVEIQNMSTSVMWFGPDGENETSGYRLPGIDGASIRIEGTFAIFGQSETGTPEFCYYEVYG